MVKETKTSGTVLKKRYNEAEPQLETVSSLMKSEDEPVQLDNNLAETLRNIYNTLNGKINIKYANNKLNINGINHPVDIGLNLLNNFINKDKVPIDNIIFNKNNTVGINGTNISNVYDEPTRATEVVITMGNVKYYLMPKNIVLTTDQLKAIHRLEIINKSKWPHMLSDVIRDAYSDKVVEYSLMIATLNLNDEEIYMPADKILEVAIQNGFISLNDE